MRKLQTPDVTKMQVVALVTFISGAMASMGAPLSAANEARLFNAAVALAVVQMFADAIIRFGRAMMVGKKVDPADFGLDVGDED